MSAREQAEGLLMRGALALPRRLQKHIFGSGPAEVRGEKLHRDFATILRLGELTRMPSLETIGQEQGLAAARKQYAHICRMGTRISQTLAVETTPSSASGGTGALPALLHTPQAESKGLMVYFHGGGFMLGDTHAYTPYLRYLSHTTQISILAVQYRLAPEHPFPAGVDDAVAALKDAITSARDYAGPILVGGDSAGAVLAIQAAHAATTAGHPPKAVLLFNPGVHVRGRYASDDDFAEGYGFTKSMRTWFEATYLPDMARSKDERVSPLFLSSFEGFPKTWLSVGSCDPLRDQVEAFAERLCGADVDVLFTIEPGFIHNYPMFLGLSSDVRAATDRACAWLADAI